MSIAVICLILFAVFATSILSAVLGMAGGVVLMGVLGSLLSVSSAMIVHGVSQMSANGLRAWIQRRHILWGIMPGYLAGMIVSTAIMFALALVPGKAMLFLFIGLVALVGSSLPRSLSIEITAPGRPFVCGFVVGGVQLLAGVAGPVLDLFFLGNKLGRQQVVATKAVTQTVSHVSKVLYYGLLLTGSAGTDAVGATDASVLTPAFWLLLPCLPVFAYFGTAAGSRLLEKISDGQFRRATRLVVFVLGLVYLARSAWLMAWG